MAQFNNQNGFQSARFVYHSCLFCNLTQETLLVVNGIKSKLLRHSSLTVNQLPTFWVSARRMNASHVIDEENHWWSLSEEYSRFPSVVCMQDNWRLMNKYELESSGEIDCLCCYDFTTRVVQFCLIGEFLSHIIPWQANVII